MIHQRIIDSFHEHIQKYYINKGRVRDNHDDLHNVLTVSAIVCPNFIHCLPDHKGAMHQHFYINITKVLEGDESLVDNNTVFVAVHYGDSQGIREEIPGLTAGQPIDIKGKFIPAAKAYRTDDNPCFPVLHFTHHPVGYVIYNEIRYE